MFEVPQAKRVKRSQLFNSDDEHESVTAHKSSTKNKSSLGKIDSDGAGDDNIVPDYGFEYEFVSHTDPDPLSSSDLPHSTAKLPPNQPEKDTETYQFNLFAPARPSNTRPTDNNGTKPSSSTSPNPLATTTQGQQTYPLQISIRSPSPIPEHLSSGTLTNPRPLSHYLTSALPTTTLTTLRQTYQSASIDPSTLTKLSTLPWPGTNQPWRTIHLPAHWKQVVIIRTNPKSTSATTPKPTPSTQEPHSQPPRLRRARPSLKRRQLIRSKARKRQKIIDETKTKEEHEREKRNRKNRERKVKRRAKERREKEVGKEKEKEKREGSVGEGGES